MAPASPATGTAPVASAPKSEPGRVTIAAEGLVNPGDPRYSADKALMQSDLRADAKRQLVVKALGLMVDANSFAKNYDLLRDKLLPQSGSYISTVVQESPPRLGKDGLMSMTTQAVVDVRALQKSLNQMSRDERVDFIRASGDPRISVQITLRDADQPNAPPQPSPVAENLLKERIKAFGFRTWSDENSVDARQGADFAVQGEVQVKKLSARLEASGVVITKYTLVSWTVKCLDRATGEEIYFNTALPKGIGSWASEGDAMKAIGMKIADEFSRNFFLQHVTVTGRKVTLDRCRRAGRRGRRRARSRADRPSRRARDDPAGKGGAAGLRPAACRQRCRRRSRRIRRVEGAQRQAWARPVSALAASPALKST